MATEFPIAQPAGEIVDERGRRGLHRRQVNVTRRLAPRTLDLQPGKPPLTAWSIVGDGSIGSPSDHIRSFQLSQSNLSACLISAFARKKDYARAIADYTEAFRLDPDYAEALMRRGIVRRLNGGKAGGDADVFAARRSFLILSNRAASTAKLR